MKVFRPSFVSDVQVRNRLLQEIDVHMFYAEATGRLTLIVQKKGEPVPDPAENETPAG
jgi:hypothetical protein